MLDVLLNTNEVLIQMRAEGQTDSSVGPSFGPYWSWPSVSHFSDVSKRAFEIWHERLTPDLTGKFGPVRHLFVRMLYLAEGTSFSIRLLTSWAMTLQALALARVRLEQAIVCSYLVHEDESAGIEPFVRHISIKRYQNTRAALSDSGIATQLGSVDLATLQAEAITSQERITPGFDIDHDRLQRKWTRLDLRAMARRRDELTADGARISKDRLERDYVSLYKSASSIVHSDCSALSHAYLDIFPAMQPDGPAVLMPLPSWATTSVAFTSHYDILQVFEVLRLFGIDCEDELEELRTEWLECIEKHL